MTEIKKYLKNFFYSKGQPSAGKFWATIFCVLFTATLILRLVGIDYITDTLIGIIVGAIGTTVGLYTVGKTRQPS